MIDYILRFVMSLGNLLLLQYFIISFKDIKTKTTQFQYFMMVIESLVCAGVYKFGNPKLSLVAVIIAIFLECLLIDAVVKYKIGMAFTYIAIGMVIQYIVHLFLFIINVKTNSDNAINLFCTMFIFLLLQASVIISLCKLFGNRKVRLVALSGEILNVLVIYSIIEVLICNVIMKNAINMKSGYCYFTSFVVLVLILALYYLALILMRKLTELITKQNDYEKNLKEIAYEREKSKIGRMAKHDIRRKLFEYIYLIENNEYDKLISVLKYQYEELQYLDEKMYSFNPALNSVLRGCIGKIKGREIRVETNISIPEDVDFYDGDFGVLLSNLIDNAIESCEKVEPSNRFINILIKVVEENMYIHIENSKISDTIDVNVSTKDDPESHGIGIKKIKEIFEKYDGNVKFEQDQITFAVKGFLHCYNRCQAVI